MKNNWQKAWQRHRERTSSMNTYPNDNWKKGTRLILHNTVGMLAPFGAKAIVTKDVDEHLVEIDWTYHYKNAALSESDQQARGIYRKDRFIEDPEQDEQAYYKAITENVEANS